MWTTENRKRYDRSRLRYPSLRPSPPFDLHRPTSWKLLIAGCRKAPGSAKPARGPILASNRQASLRHRLTAPTFAPLTGCRRKSSPGELACAGRTRFGHDSCFWHSSPFRRAAMGRLQLRADRPWPASHLHGSP